ncbi:hypothetical protein CRX72_29755 [Pantoea sp. BRM17]|nr:hypothetical protein CRX72_29755 [Pantoea sp. BRM17]
MIIGLSLIQVGLTSIGGGSALLICQALGLPAQDTQHIISMSLFASGVASLLQIKTWGPVGSGLLSIQGTSFNFVTPLIMGGMALDRLKSPLCCY